MISKPKNLKVVTLQLALKLTYQENLDLLIKHIIKHQDKDLLIAPEVCLTGFDYKNMHEASKFSHQAIQILKHKIHTQILILTIITKKENCFYNQALVIHEHKIIHTQEKVKLFTLGQEQKYFKAGHIKKIQKFEINGVSYAILICFELRFKELWQQIEGADIILIPSRWGKPRKNHLEILSNALAIMNQCFVILSNASDTDMASSSAILSPFGNITKDDRQTNIESRIDLQEIRKMRRYISLDTKD
ncbi:Aliphatic amidase AmiE [hydrothermal vent metagenome]|uniref:Aliphatic amidase AmiE n=1 Tax=hydrothermal vent metagenome TaxID=652676 RepID=A0A1W1CYU2_9ZZZZ